VNLGSVTSLGAKLRKWAPKRGWTARVAEAPLLGRDDLTALRSAATAAGASERARPQSSQPWLGDVSSVYRGRGYEFDENRLYGPGDETRFINWRLYARTGQLHTKVFHEEHRPEVFVLLDRRSGMRFGTRRQLKVTQGARIACFHLFHARARAMAAGGLLLQQPPLWLARAQDDPSLDALVSEVITPCPPVRQDADTPGLIDMLRQAQALLAPGATLILISDFHDLDIADAGTIWEVARHYDLRAYRIVDPAEAQLPRHADYMLCDSTGDARVDLADIREDVLAEYETRFARHAELCQHVFAGAGVALRVFSTEDDVIPELQRAPDGTDAR